MKTIKYFFKYSIIALLAGVIFSSCESWLDVKPDNETAASVLFSTERGFQEALSGIYTLMTEPELYGRELTFGMAGVLAQQYDWLHELSPYYYIQRNFDFAADQTRLLSDGVWNKQFNAIANVNDLLAFIDERKNVFASDESYAIIKGEALALRAYLHFDILRLFAPHKDAPEGAKKWVPYVEEFSKNTTGSMTFDEVTGKIMADLSDAAVLLENDPIYSGRTLTDLYFKNRQYHMNYYAVKGLTARVCIYAGLKEKALECAKEVIEAQQGKGLFPFVNGEEVTNPETDRRDRTFSCEHLFTLNIRDLQSSISGYLSQAQSGMALNNRELPDNLYEGYPDYRREFFEVKKVINPWGWATEQAISTKLWQVDPTNTYKYKMPMIRISEMYYIAAECGTDATMATGYLNTVRRARNIHTDLLELAPEQLRDELLKEYRKEFVCEGQLFYYYKRIGAYDAGWGSMPFKYVLYMPDNEISFAGRPRPGE